LRDSGKLSFEALYDAFTSDYEQALGSFYDNQKKSFMNWARARFSVDDDTLVDVYQDAVIVLYNRVIKKNTGEIKSSPESYLFGIAKNLLLKNAIKQKKMVSTDNVYNFVPDEGETELTKKYDDDHDKMKIDTAMSKLDEGCRKILYLYYYRRCKLDAIVEQLGYENTDVVKSRKYQCMKKLRSIMALVKI